MPEHIEYADLVREANAPAPSGETLQLLQRAYGQGKLGILVVDNIPGLAEAREHLLCLSARLASLDKSTLSLLEDPASAYLFGWACGREIVDASGKADTSKGSFYANPFMHDAGGSQQAQQRYPALARPNRWPSTALPELEKWLKHTAMLLRDAGEILTALLDAYISYTTACNGQVSNALAPEAHKGRLLHYYAPRSNEDNNDTNGKWCGLHRDHSILTALLKGRFAIEHEGEREVPAPDETSGLYIQDKNSGLYSKISYAPTSAAFQLGEAAQVLTGGRLEATPHYVQAPSAQKGSKDICRDTFALFMQPHWDARLNPPFETDVPDVAHYKRGATFGEFSEAKAQAYY